MTLPARPAAQQWTLYRLLAHARTLPENSIQPDTDITYVERTLQDWPKYETGVLQGHTRPPDTTDRTTWDDLLPNIDISALAKLIQNTAPRHTFADSYIPAIVSVILAYHNWTTQQRLHLHSASDDPREWHLIGPPVPRVYFNKDPATAAHVITDLRPVTPHPISEPFIPPKPTTTPLPSRGRPAADGSRPTSPQQRRTYHHSQIHGQTPHHAPRSRQLPAAP